VYVRGFDGSVVMIDLAGSNSEKVPVEIRHYSFVAEGTRTDWQGMAIYAFS